MSRNFAATSSLHANLRRISPMGFPAALILGLAVILAAVARAPAVSVQVRCRFFTVVQSDDERQKKRVVILARHLASSRCTSDPVSEQSGPQVMGRTASHSCSSRGGRCRPVDSAFLSHDGSARAQDCAFSLRERRHQSATLLPSACCVIVFLARGACAATADASTLIAGQLAECRLHNVHG